MALGLDCSDPLGPQSGAIIPGRLPCPLARRFIADCLCPSCALEKLLDAASVPERWNGSLCVRMIMAAGAQKIRDEGMATATHDNRA